MEKIKYVAITVRYQHTFGAFIDQNFFWNAGDLCGEIKAFFNLSFTRAKQSLALTQIGRDNRTFAIGTFLDCGSEFSRPSVAVADHN